MPTSAAIAQNISSTQVQSANFSFSIVFSPSEGSDVDNDSFTISNIQISGSSDVSISNLQLISFNNNVGLVVVVLPDEVMGSFSIALVGNITVDGTSDTITATAKTIQYNTLGNIQATFGTVVYNSDTSISIPVSFELDVKSLSRTDFNLINRSGEDISNLQTFLFGKNRNYDFVLIPEPDTQGIVRIDLRGELFNSGMPKNLAVTPIDVRYNTLRPFSLLRTHDNLNASRKRLDFNIPIKGIKGSSFDIEGSTQIQAIYRFHSITSSPTDAEYNELTDATKWLRETDLQTATTAKGKYFVVEFTAGNVDAAVFVKENEIINAVYP